MMMKFFYIICLFFAIFLSIISTANPAFSESVFEKINPFSSSKNKNTLDETPTQMEVEYKLGAGDTIKITVFGEEDLSGEFNITPEGFISFPLLGEVQANGKTPKQFEHTLTEALKNGYLLNPKVTIEIEDYRHFFIVGEVNSPGSFPYKSGMSILNAVALGGGFTYRAKESKVILKRGGKEYKVPVDTKILPGDSITVEERLF